ncbi:MAG: glycosyltransferase [Acidiferrobacterales bacterium]|nr:glycosyltransferase [Acidiferrobacterales bacterium]
MANKNILLVNYDYPPAGGIGTQRIYHFAKYLKRSGYNPIVLTNIHGLGKGIDNSLIGSKEFESIPTIRMGGEELVSHHLGNLRGVKKLIYNGKLAIKYLHTGQIYHSWYVDCRGHLKNIVEDYQIDCVWTTSPTYSSLFFGREIKKSTNTPWIIDLRDSIVGRTESTKNLINYVSGLASAYWEKVLCPHADHIVGATPGIIESLTQRCGKQLSRTSTSLIYNGFDPDDYIIAVDSVSSPSKKLQIAYTGTFLGRRNPDNLITALKRLSKLHPEYAAQLKFVFAGEYAEPIRKRLLSLERNYEIELTGFMPRTDIISLQLNSDVLLLLTVDVVDKNQSEVLTGKVFEYIGANKPILATCPSGPLNDLITQHNLGLTSPPGDSRKLFENLKLLGEQWLRSGKLAYFPDQDIRAKFDRSRQVKQLIQIIEEVTT